MARLIISVGFCEINGVDLTDRVTAVAVNKSAEEVPITNLQSAGQERMQGLRSDSYELGMQQDFAAAEVHATLKDLFENGTEFVVKVRPKAGAASPTNPEQRGTCILTEYPVLQGSVGDLAAFTLPIPVNGKIAEVTA